MATCPRRKLIHRAAVRSEVLSGSFGRSRRPATLSGMPSADLDGTGDRPGVGEQRCEAITSTAELGRGGDAVELATAGAPVRLGRVARRSAHPSARPPRAAGGRCLRACAVRAPPASVAGATASMVLAHPPSSPSTIAQDDPPHVNALGHYADRRKWDKVGRVQEPRRGAGGWASGDPVRGGAEFLLSSSQFTNLASACPNHARSVMVSRARDQDAPLIFGQVWERQVLERGLENIGLPKEIMWRAARPAREGHQHAVHPARARPDGAAIVVATCWTHPRCAALKDRGHLSATAR